MRRTQVDGKFLTDEHISYSAFLGTPRGMDTTAGVTGNTILELDKDPALRQQMIDEIDFIPKAIEEFLRFAGPQGGLYRRGAADNQLPWQPMHTKERLVMS